MLGGVALVRGDAEVSDDLVLVRRGAGVKCAGNLKQNGKFPAVPPVEQGRGLGEGGTGLVTPQWFLRGPGHRGRSRNGAATGSTDTWSLQTSSLLP